MEAAHALGFLRGLLAGDAHAAAASHRSVPRLWADIYTAVSTPSMQPVPVSFARTGVPLAMPQACVPSVTTSTDGWRQYDSLMSRRIGAEFFSRRGKGIGRHGVGRASVDARAMGI